VSKSQDIEKLLAGLDKRTTRYKKTKAYLESRARPGQVKTVTGIRHIGNKNAGLPEGEVTLTAGKCPCSICGHEWMWECVEANEGRGCDCCSSTCT